MAMSSSRPLPVYRRSLAVMTAATRSAGFQAQAFFYSHSMSKDLKVGFGVYGNFGLGLDYDSDWVGRYYVQEGTLLGLSLQPTVAYRVNGKLSVAEPIPCAASRLRQVPTVATRIPSSAATSSLRLPARQPSTIFARSTRRASSVRLLLNRSSSRIASGVQLSGTATLGMQLPSRTG
jgi:long-subunit fatty acid transport protein